MDTFFLYTGIFLAATFTAFCAREVIKYIRYNPSDAEALEINETHERAQGSHVSSKEEQQIRSNWLRAVFIFLLGTTTFHVGSCLILFFSGDLEGAREGFIEALRVMFIQALSTAILYYFAYVKFGTKWIAFVLFTSPARIIIDTIKEMNETFRSPDITTSGISVFVILYLVPVFLFCYFWIHCKRLYELNRIIKKRIKEEKKLEAAQAI